MKYKVGDIVTLVDKRGYDIADCGKIVLTGIDRYNGKDKYLVECYSNELKRNKNIAFYDEEIAGLKEN